jgi:hypothetical protein
VVCGVKPVQAIGGLGSERQQSDQAIIGGA